MSNAAQKMVKARANLVMGNPFFGTLALRLKMVEDKTVKTSSTDGTTLRAAATEFAFLVGIPTMFAATGSTRSAATSCSASAVSTIS